MIRDHFPIVIRDVCKLKTRSITQRDFLQGPAGWAVSGLLRSFVAVAIASLLALGVQADDDETVDCPTLLNAYRALEGPETDEHLRLSEILFSACAGTEIKLLRATTLDGAPVLEVRGPILSPKVETP